MICFLPIQRVFLSSKQAECTKNWDLRAELKASVGHIWPAGRLFCMPGLQYHSCNARETIFVI